jgi:hypothetical protein
MILTPIAPDALADVLDRYATGLAGRKLPHRVFGRIRATRRFVGDDAARFHRDAVALAHWFGMNPLAEAPQQGFSWDGARVRSLSEPAVLLHEVAHFQLASPSRRRLPDFGLGAGPETGRAAEADRVRSVDDAAREIEEQMASLLGVLWEVELGQPAILAFQEQNWLEGAGRRSAADFLALTLDRLTAAQLLDPAGRPVRALRATPDPAGRGAAPAALRR